MASRSLQTWARVAALAAAALLIGSAFEGWLIQDRVLLGEGYRRHQTLLSAWEGAAVPVLAAGLVLSAFAGVGAIAATRALAIGPRIWLAAGLSSAALLVGSLAPIAVDRHAMNLAIHAGPLGWAGAAIAVASLAITIRAVRPEHGAGERAVLLIVFVALVAGSAGGRWALLEVGTPTGENWSEGAYAGTVDGDPVTLEIDGGRYTLGARWSGTWESSGWTVILTDDSACPGVRGTYHAHDEGDAGRDLRFVKVVDTCADGERAELLEDAIWVRQP